MGANIALVAVVKGVVKNDKGDNERPFSLLNDLDDLDARLSEGGYGLLIIDPVNAYLRGVDGHRDSDVRSAVGRKISSVSEPG